MNRQFLVTKFACSQCGSLLNLSYDVPKAMRHAEGEPTGAAMVEKVVGVEPCETCLAPARKAAEAVATLMKIGTPGG